MDTLYINGLKGQRVHSPGQRPGCKDARKVALKGQKHGWTEEGFCPFRAHIPMLVYPQGVALGCALLPLWGAFPIVCYHQSVALGGVLSFHCGSFVFPSLSFPIPFFPFRYSNAGLWQ